MAQVFQVEKDMKITCSPNNNKNPKSTENEKLKNGTSWAPSHDISYGTSQDNTWEASYIKDISVNSLLTLIKWFTVLEVSMCVGWILEVFCMCMGWIKREKTKSKSQA